MRDFSVCRSIQMSPVFAFDRVVLGTGNSEAGVNPFWGILDSWNESPSGNSNEPIGPEPGPVNKINGTTSQMRNIFSVDLDLAGSDIVMDIGRIVEGTHSRRPEEAIKMSPRLANCDVVADIPFSGLQMG